MSGRDLLSELDSVASNCFLLLWLLGARGAQPPLWVADPAFGLTLGDEGNVSSRQPARFAVVKPGRPAVVGCLGYRECGLRRTEDGRERPEPV